MSYKYALLGQYIKDPANCAEKALVEDVAKEWVIIRDKFPKSKHHYLIIARQGATEEAKPPLSVLHLEKRHLPLLQTYKAQSEKLMAKHIDLPTSAWQVGFHAIPSLYPLHLHVMTRDLDSPLIKNKHHWHSFSTAFFLPLSRVTASIEEFGKVPDQTRRWKFL